MCEGHSDGQIDSSSETAQLNEQQGLHLDKEGAVTSLCMGLEDARRHSMLLSSEVFPDNYSITVVNLLASQGERGTVVTVRDYADDSRKNLEKVALRGQHGHPWAMIVGSNSFTSEGLAGQSRQPEVLEKGLWDYPLPSPSGRQTRGLVAQGHMGEFASGPGLEPRVLTPGLDSPGWLSLQWGLQTRGPPRSFLAPCHDGFVLLYFG